MNPIQEFEAIKDKAELQALSDTSLKRELTDAELHRFKELMQK
jgi:hypothetical protein